MPVITPTLERERDQLARYPGILACVDEVGRGSIAGPVCVGISLLTPYALEKGYPQGVRDSKMLSASARERLAPQCRQWLPIGVGYGSVEEIDRDGIIVGLQWAACRALEAAMEEARRQPQLLGLADGEDCAPASILLDGTHNWWEGGMLFGPPLLDVPVETMRKGDANCAGIAAASVVAKVERDHLMEELAQAFPDYGWEANKGYASAQHTAALAAHGVTVHHRTSWHLPGIEAGEGS